MTFDDLLPPRSAPFDPEADDSGVWSTEVDLPADWGQGRALFGGLVAALALRAMERGVEADRRLRSATLSFLGPVAPGGSSVEARLLRRGGSVTQLEARVTQDGTARTVVLGSFAADRASGLAVEPPPPPEVAGPDGLAELPFLPGVTPRFTRHLAYRWARGDAPFSGGDGRGMTGWCRLREAGDRPGGAGAEHVMALVDAWPAGILSQLDRPAPASSVTWTLDLPTPPAQDDRADDWWLFETVTEFAAAGTAHARSSLWSPSGRLVGLSRQTVAVFG
jgi:acyl-CoA thioesterase